MRRIVLLAVLAALLLPPAALAHVGDNGLLQTVTQSVGPYELSVTFELPPAAPAPLNLSIASRADLGGATLTLRAAPRGADIAAAPPVELKTVAGTPLIYKAQLALDRPGEWRLELHAEGPLGAGATQIPFTVTPAQPPPYSLPLAVSLGGLAALLLAGVVVSGVSQSRGRPAGRASWMLGQLAFGCAVAAAVFGGLQYFETYRAAQAGPAPEVGRPHVNLLLSTEPAAPRAGEPMLLTLDLSDGGTGLPVDDLSPHHEALAHLIVIDESGAEFQHVHPARVAPGRFQISITPERAGVHTAYLELARHLSGTQIVARQFTVAGDAAAPPPDPPGLGARVVDGLEVDVTSSATPIQAGRQAVLGFTFSAGGQPAQDIEPWLGMAGHLIVLGSGGAVIGHVHAVEAPPPPGPQGSGTRYGPTVRFAYTFPAPGTYRVWGQFQRGGRIITVPLLIEVIT